MIKEGKGRWKKRRKKGRKEIRKEDKEERKKGKKERTAFGSVRGSSNSSLGMYKRKRIYRMNILIPIFKYGDGDLTE